VVDAMKRSDFFESDKFYFVLLLSLFGLLLAVIAQNQRETASTQACFIFSSLNLHIGQRTERDHFNKSSPARQHGHR
jgi:hypothetical protein